jgi:hypothetical protein
MKASFSENMALLKRALNIKFVDLPNYLAEIYVMQISPLL